MKKLILIAMLFAGCDISPCKREKIIIYKSYQTFMNNPMPDGICRYAYSTCLESQEFQDKCDKYNVGDTIK